MVALTSYGRQREGDWVVIDNGMVIAHFDHSADAKAESDRINAHRQEMAAHDHRPELKAPAKPKRSWSDMEE